jgi:hypothetical protein
MVRVRNFIFSADSGVLNLKNTRIREMSEIEGLEDEPNLHKIILRGNKIKKIEGLANLKTLMYLDLRNNMISDISGLDKLTNLKGVYLSNNQISKIRGLDKLRNLKEISLYGNKITKVVGLGKLLNLQKLNLGGNPIPKETITELGGVDYLGYAVEPQKFVQYCRHRKMKKKEVRKFIKTLHLVYDQIKLEKIQARTGVDIKDLEPILEKMIIKGDLGAKVSSNTVIFDAPKKKEIEKPVKPTFPIEIGRGFEVAGDTFKFFIRVDNISEFAITKVSVKLLLPFTLKFDEKSKENQYSLGDIGPEKFSTANFYVFCESCADTVINASVDFKDHKGNYQIEKMRPFEIRSCKYISPRRITIEEFLEKYDKVDKKQIEIKLKDDLTNIGAIQLLKERMTMETIASTANSVEMSGITRDGLDILLRSVIREVQGVKTLVATVVSNNQSIQIGALSEIIETFKDHRKDIRKEFKGVIDGQEQLKETIIKETNKILNKLFEEYDVMEEKHDILANKTKTLQEKFTQFELNGSFDEADKVNTQLESIRNEFRSSFKELNSKQEKIAINIEKILDTQDNLEQFLMEKLASDWDKIKDSWKDFKSGKITRKQLILHGFKAVGKGFGKLLVGQFT